MNFFQTLLRPDFEEEPDKALVARAANLLQIGEFQFLQLAYREWHGDDLGEPMLGQLFKYYMLYDRVPTWARHYARRIIDLDRAGRLDDRDPRFHCYDHDYKTFEPRGVARFTVAASMIAVVLVGGIVIGDHLGGRGTSVLPPYFEKNELEPAKSRHDP